MPTDESERRRHPRIPVRLPVRVSTIDPETDPWTGRPFFRASREWCENVSRGGIRLLTHEPYAPGRRVLLEMQLPDGTAVEAMGRVRWATRVIAGGSQSDDDAGIGVEFLGASPRELEALERFLRDGAR
ncbi:MAG TPA: PilZ domain-containing protein [Myxococcota bacterium]|jgi:Tfp pilus assembly protein PilZ|nr:PilZ domain-containing protein [Myxococcota bacterium]